MDKAQANEALRSNLRAYVASYRAGNTDSKQTFKEIIEAARGAFRTHRNSSEALSGFEKYITDDHKQNSMMMIALKTWIEQSIESGKPIQDVFHYGVFLELSAAAHKIDLETVTFPDKE